MSQISLEGKEAAHTCACSAERTNPDHAFALQAWSWPAIANPVKVRKVQLRVSYNDGVTQIPFLWWNLILISYFSC